MDKNILPTGDVSIFSPSGSHQYNFTESALIHFVTTTDYSSLHELFEKTTKLGSVPEGGLQITEIAINEGSTKTFVNSILTETVQNSLDAIRTKLPINTYIDLRLEKCAEHKIIFSITDYVGMEMNGIIATMIPFLSSKTPSEIVTGEMGSGFFNVYRESKKVLIKTVHNSKAVIILDTPVHDKNNRVVDIKRSVQIKKSDESNHTTIYVLICAQNAFEYTDIISDFLFMIQNVMTLIEGANIRFNDKEIGIKTETLYDTEHFNFQINVSDWMITESYIFTKGVPFASLHNYFSDKNVIQQFVLDGLEYNSVLNIKHGLFTPVQTRSKLNISPKNFKLLTDFLYNSLYLQKLHYITHTRREEKAFNEIIPNFTSETSLDQILFTRNVKINQYEVETLDRFMIYYSFEGNPSIESLINKSYYIMEEKGFKDNPDLKKKVEKMLVNTTRIKSCREAVILWLSTKNNQKEGEQILEKKDKTTFLNNEIMLKKVFTIFMKLYWQGGADLDIKGFKQSIPKIKIEKISDLIAGCYEPFIHTITINSQFLKNSDKFIESIKTKNIINVKNSSIFQKYFMMSMPASTLIHEIEHARRNSSHTDAGVHDTIYETYPDIPTKLYTFDESANQTYEIIMRETPLLQEWLKNSNL